MEKSNVLYVQMFGNHQIRYNGHPLTGEKMRDTHFTNLMQVLLHNVSNGVSRDYLEDLLLGDRDVENRHQALQTIVYKAKQKLKNMGKSAGLPDLNYIIFENGTYYWTPQIPVSEDAALFDELCRSAEECEDEDKRLKLYLEACYTYRGEFLPLHTAVLWASAEARRYQKQFDACVKQAAMILRKKEAWISLEKLGRYASETEPYSNWESLTMEALVESGRGAEGSKFYVDTVDYYLNKQGIYPSAAMMDMIEKLGNQILHTHEVFEHVYQVLSEEKEDVSGGYQCTYPTFCGIYRLAVRMAKKRKVDGYLMMCTLVDSKGNFVKEGERFEELGARLDEAIKSSVRQGDAICRYGKGQFLVLLLDMTKGECEKLQKCINRNFATGRQRIGVQYHIKNLIGNK